MDRLLRPDVWTIDRAGKMSRDQTGWDWQDLAPPSGKVAPAGDGAGGKGSLRYGAVGRGGGGRD